MSLPVRALLLTDVVDSTRLGEALGDEGMARLWAAHDRVARDLLPLHRGREIDKTDGFLLLFESADDALAYAIAYHQACATIDPPVQARAGLHVGEVILTHNHADDVALGAKPLEVDGMAKPTAARVMSVASGGQTLLTPEAVAALSPGEHRVVSHGHWRMKGVAQPIELSEAGGEGAPFLPPPDGAKVVRVVERDGLWQPLREVPHSLPRERDAFVGRADDLQQIARCFTDGARLVTLLGIGGTGKTRLAVRYGWTWLGDHPGGVWFCDLSEARDVDGIVGAVARGLDVRAPGADALATVGRALAERGDCLVVFDNFEQVASCADLLGDWLDTSPRARFLVTSREVLGLAGEHLLALPPLDPTDAVALFVERARAARRDFVVGDDADAVEELVRLLDQLRLAIELAAARVRVMPPRQLLSRMSDRFRLLASRGGRDRQATLRGALDWSWELLDSDERAGLAQLSVFEGGLSLAAAEAVLDLGDAWATDVVQGLVDKSLLRQRVEDRFDLLLSVREYAGEKLREQGGVEPAEARHGAFYARRRADPSEPGRPSPASRPTGAGAADLGNLTSACRRATLRGDAATAVATLLSASEVLRLHGPTSAAVALAEGVLSDCPLPDDQEPRVRCALAASLALAGRIDEVGAHLEAALSIHRRRDDRAGEAVLLGTHLANLYFEQGRLAEAQQAYERAVVLHREVGNRWGEANALRNLGTLLGQRGDAEGSQAALEAALGLHHEVGDARGATLALSKIANLHYRAGRLEQTVETLEQVLEATREQGDRIGEGVHLGNLGLLDLELGRLGRAEQRIGEALRLHRELGYRFALGDWLSGLARLRALQGDLPAAQALAIEAIEAAEGYPRLQADHWVTLAELRREADDLDGARQAVERAEALAGDLESGSPLAVRLAKLR